MVIGPRIRELRESRNLSQGDIEKRTGLARCYTSRVENGRTVPSIETLEKYARALEIPLYGFFYEGKLPIKPNLRPGEKTKSLWGTSAKEWPELRTLAKSLGRMDERDRKLLLLLAQGMTRRSRTK